MQTSYRTTSLIALLAVLAPRGVHAQSSEEARVLFQKAKQTMQADSAEDAYLTVALSHPTSPYAAESLLRLGQARLANNDAKQAVVYLQRLMSDYPRSEFRPLGALWLGRAQIATNNAAAACTTIRTALQMPQVDSETAALLQTEQATACSAQGGTKASAPSAAPATAVKSGARYAIQVGAFRERAGARSVARTLDKAGFERVRVVVMPENALYRVRVGQYESAADANATVAKLKAAGHNVAVVSDRQREKIVQD